MNLKIIIQWVVLMELSDYSILNQAMKVKMLKLKRKCLIVQCKMIKSMYVWCMTPRILTLMHATKMGQFMYLTKKPVSPLISSQNCISLKYGIHTLIRNRMNQLFTHAQMIKPLKHLIQGQTKLSSIAKNMKQALPGFQLYKVLNHQASLIFLWRAAMTALSGCGTKET